jgi:hypothetical protein
MFLVAVYAHMELRRKAVFGYAKLDNRYRKGRRGGAQDKDVLEADYAQIFRRTPTP